MSITKKILIGILVLVILLGGGALTYRLVKAQGVTAAYVINQDLPAQPRILIATQKRGFKDKVMADVVTYYTGKDVFISVIDITTLGAVEAGDWDGVILFTTIESSEPPQIVTSFLEQQKDLSKQFLVLTADSGQWADPNITGVDVVTSASINNNTGTVSGTIIEKINTFISDKQ